MANDAITISFMPFRGAITLRLAECAFLAFLLLIFVSLSPFAIRDPLEMATAKSAAGAAGDAWRQLSYAGAFAAIVYSALRERGIQAVQSLAPALALLLVWCLASAAWSAEPDITLRRAALATVIVLSATLSVGTLGPSRSFALLRIVLGLVLAIDWLSIALVHQAVHLANDPEPSLVGDWRGLFFHKNIAGAVSALTAIVFLFSAWQSRKLVDLLLGAAAIGFLVGTQSHSSLGILPVALAAGVIYRVAWRRPLDRLIVAVAAGLLVVASVAFAVMDQSAIMRVLADPSEFTGRTVIWQAELAFIRDHPWLGAGFGSLADTGALSPLHDYVSSNWVNSVSHGHNAYLQLCATIGIVGLTLAAFALLLGPLIAFWRGDGSGIGEKALFFAIFVFLVLHNFVESDFLEGDSPAWVCFLMVLAALRQRHASAPAEHV